MAGDPLRIAMISYYLPSGSKIGIGYQVHALAEEMVRRGNEVTVFSACPAVVGASYSHRPVELTGALRTFRFATTLRSIDFSGFDVIHAHGDDYWMWRRRVPAHIRTLHGSCFSEALHISGPKERIRMLALGGSEVLASLVADRTVAVSPPTRRWTPWVRMVVPNGVDLQVFCPHPTDRSDRPVVLFVGAWSGRKRGALLADAFVRQVLPRVPGAELWMVSSDVPIRVHSAIRALGRLSTAELADAYRRAWIFCLPASYEGFGIPYVEAMASGLPVVATPNAGAKYVTDRGRTGLLVKPSDLGETLAELLLDDTRRDVLAQRGLQRAKNFSLTAVCARYESLYRETIAARR